MLVYFTIALGVLLGCCGMAIDIGRIELRTTQLQAAADDGAITAAAENQRGNISNYTTLVQNEVSAFLTQANLPAATTASQYVASTGPYSNNDAALQVTVTQALPLYFTALIGLTSRTITAKAVALLPPCAYFRSAPSNPSPTGHLATASLRASCPVYTYGSFTNDYFSYVGNNQLEVTGTAAGSGSSGSFSYPAVYNAPVLPDPLAYLVAPFFSSCTYTNKSYSVATTISPGTYCGGITVTGAIVTMNPGLYIITGGMSINSSATLTGTGVTMYFTTGGGSSFGQVRMSSSTFTVNAPTDSSGGGIPGIVIFGDRNWSGSQYDLILSSDNYQSDGIIYMTNTGLTMTGTTMASGGHYFGLDIACLYEYLSTIYPIPGYSQLPGGNPFHTPVTLLQ